MRIFRRKKASDWVQGPDGKWTKENPDVTDILEALEVTRPCLSTEGPVWTPEEHERFVQELQKYPAGAFGLIKRIGTKSAAQVTSYGFKCWKSDEYQQVVANRQQRRARRPSYRVRKWLSAALKWCGDAFSLRCLRSRFEPQATVQSDVLYSPGIFDTESLRPRSIAGPAPRGAICILQAGESVEDESDAHQATEQIEWYRSRVLRSAPNIPAIEKKAGPWTKEEHERYCEALEMYRYGSWKLIADYVRTRTDRQVMSHAQSIRAKRKRAEKREEQQNMTKNRGGEQTGVPTKVAKTTAGGRIDPSTGKTTPTTDTPSQEARHSLELPDETAEELSSTKAGEAFHSPLCSPPPDILIGSFLSDEDFFEMIDPLSPLTGETFTFNSCMQEKNPATGTVTTICTALNAPIVAVKISSHFPIIDMSRSSSSSVWTRGSETNWTMPENKKPSRIILSTLQVKVMPMQRGYSAFGNTADELKQRHRFSKWLKTSFQWCVRALTLRCLWKKPTTFTEAIATSTQAPAMQSKPIVSRNHQRSSASIGQSPTQERNLHRKSQRTAPFAKVDGDANTRSARLAARESEWCGAAKRLLTPTRDLVKKSGIWSADEHERYCEALEMFRYGSWKQIAGYVGTRTERQVLSHAQSIRARKEKDNARKQPRTAVQSGVRQEPWRNLFTESRNSTPEELLVASMTDAPPNPLSGLDPSSADTISTDFPSMDLSFELNIEDLEVANADEESKNDGWEEFTGNKRAKPNSEVSITFDGLLTSSSLEMLLDGILSDDDLHELLEISSTQSEIQSTIAGGALHN